MAISTYALISVAELRESLQGGFATDARLDSTLADVCNMASDAMERYLDRFVVTRGNITAYFTPPHYTSQLYFYEWPVLSVTSVHQSLVRTWDNTTKLTADTDYVLSTPPNRFGYLTRTIDNQNGPIYWYPYWRAVRVIYSAGYATTTDVPAGLKLQTLKLAVKIWDEWKGGLSDVGTQSGPFGSMTRLSAAYVTDKMKEGLAPYRRPTEFFGYEERDAA